MEKIAQINFGSLRGFGEIGLEGESNPSGMSIFYLGRIITIVVGVLTVVASIIFLFKIITGGLAIISAGGDKGKITEARSSITNGLIGLIVVLTATIIIGFLGSIVGIQFLNLSSLLLTLRP